MDKAVIIAVCMLGLSACVTTSGNLCTAGPIILDPGANTRLTRSEKEQVVTLNNSGKTICGWSAK